MNPSEPEFDEYARGYEQALHQGLRWSGESRSYFASKRIQCVASLVQGMTIRTVMDFGCGTGDSLAPLVDQLGATGGAGVDNSAESIDEARRRFGADQRLRFEVDRCYDAPASVDLTYCNGVFHHIPPPQRPGALRYIWRQLKPGGLFACWENNPWNPGTRFVMKRVPFDRNAQTLTIPECKSMLRDAGFEDGATRTLFLFPKALKFLRGLERILLHWPIGAQYLLLVRKPERVQADGA